MRQQVILCASDSGDGPLGQLSGCSSTEHIKRRLQRETVNSDHPEGELGMRQGAWSPGV
jgi:hypothetical protein